MLRHTANTASVCSFQPQPVEGFRGCVCSCVYVCVCAVDWTLCALRARSLQLQPRREGQHRWAVPWRARGHARSPGGTTVNGFAGEEDKSVQMSAGSRRQLRAGCVILLRTGQTGFTAPQLCGRRGLEFAHRSQVKARFLYMLLKDLGSPRFLQIEISWPCLYVNTQTWKFHVSLHTQRAPPFAAPVTPAAERRSSFSLWASLHPPPQKKQKNLQKHVGHGC